MKKSLLALAVLGAFAGVASAQSSVTLSGTIDLGAKFVKNDTVGRVVSMGTDGLNASQLVFSGTEDLGGGLKAGFELNAGLAANSGSTYEIASGAAANAKFFARRSIVRLMGGFGEVRLGRDYTPTFWNPAIFDPFGTVGTGNSLNLTHYLGSVGLNVAQQPSTYIWSDNAVSYFLPGGIGGVYGQVTVAPGAGGPGKYVGGRVGFAAGPFDIAAAAGRQDVVAGGSTKFESFNLAGSYDLSVVKLMAQYNNEQLKGGTVAKETRWLLGAVVPMGQGEIHASYIRTDETSALNRDASQFALGYVYNLSKRTALYSTVSLIDNKNAGTFMIGGGAAPDATFPGKNSRGGEVGIRHFF